MATTRIIAGPFNELSQVSRNRLRAFLDIADSANPYQDPTFFATRGLREINLLVERNDQVVFFALGVENPAVARVVPWLRSLIVHKGPVADDLDAMTIGLRALKDYGRKAYFTEIRIHPQRTSKSDDLTAVCNALDFRTVSSSSPAMTLILNVCDHPDQLIMRFRKRTRYEIKRADRLGIRVKHATTESDFSNFYQIHLRRAAHKGYRALPLTSFQALSKRISAEPQRGAILLSEYRGDILAGAVVLRAGRRVHYVLGATDTYRAGNLPGAYQVLNRAIAWARHIGCTEFDFGGYGPTGEPTVRRFKEGFGGAVRTFGPPYVLTLRPVALRFRWLRRLLPL